MSKLKQSIKACIGAVAKMRVPMLAVVCIISVGSAMFFTKSLNTIKIFDGSDNYTVRSFTDDVNDVLKTVNLKSANYKIVSVTSKGNVKDVSINYIFPVHITSGDEIRVVHTVKATVREILEQSGYEITAEDLVEPSLNTVIHEESYIDYTKVEETDVSYMDSTMVSQISKLQPETPIDLDEDGNPINYKSKFTTEATAYTYTGRNCSTGVAPTPGYVAVNPNVIPYGTKLYIKSSDGRINYGYAIAADTGGFINSRPNNVDLFMQTKSDCLNFGRRNVEIYILE